MLGGPAVRHVQYTRSISPNCSTGRSRVQIPPESKEFSCFPNPTDSPWGPPNHLFNRYRGLFSGLKRPGREADRSPPSRAEVKNDWRYTYISHIRFHGAEGAFIFYGIHNYQYAVNPLYSSHNYKIICFKVSPLMTDIYLGYIRKFNCCLTEDILRLHYEA
jgi:hypothetical protein